MKNRNSSPVSRIIRSARITMFVQAALGIAGGLFILVLVSSFDLTEEDGAGLLTALAAISLTAAVVVLTCAILLPRRLPWVRLTVIVVETINGVGGLIGLIEGMAGGDVQPAGIVPILFSILVIQPLVRADVRAWFAGEPLP